MMMKLLGAAFFVLHSSFFVSCTDSFLDKAPDDRTEIDSKEKVIELFTASYPDANYGWVCELSSDNVMDLNSQHLPASASAKQELTHYNLSSSGRQDDEMFRFEPVKSSTSSDTPASIWTSFYGSINSVNEGLAALDKMEREGYTPDASFRAARAEGLLIRAYDHFILVNCFSQAYKNDELSKADIGIPYITEPITVVDGNYNRSNVTETYKMIRKDLEAGLKDMSDMNFEKPKWHFNTEAGHAFAARFYLFKRDYDQVIAHANKVLGTTASEAASVMFDAANCKDKGNIELELYAWTDVASPSNLLILSTYSFALYGYASTSCRYTFNRAPRDYTVNGAGPCWDSSFPGASIWRFDANFGGFFSKLYEPFEYTDKVAGIGFPHSLRREFTTGETLLCRSEAEIMKGDIAAAVSDMDVWAKSYLCTKDLTDSRITSFFKKGKNVHHTPVLHNEDMCPTWKISDAQMPYIWCVLHLRRIETLHDGMRFFDIKRYGIEIKHEIGYPVAPALKKIRSLSG